MIKINAEQAIATQHNLPKTEIVVTKGDNCAFVGLDISLRVSTRYAMQNARCKRQLTLNICEVHLAVSRMSRLRCT